MAALLHDAAVRERTRRRLQSLTPDSKRQWGRMSIDQMLWHCNEALEASLGRRALAPLTIPLPKALLKFFIISMPWPKGAKTHPDWIAGDRYDFAAERARCLRLVDEFAAKPVSDAWPPSAAAGPMSGTEWSRLQAKHLDHHLRQFSA